MEQDSIVATIKKLSKLFNALSGQDLHRAVNVAAEIVQEEEKKGHHSAARLLQGSLHPNSGNGTGQRTPSDVPVYQAKLLSDALSPQNPDTRITDVVLSPHARADLAEIVREWKASAELRAAGITRRSRLVFHGPPGCGKSLTAKALGLELSLPTFIVRFDGVIGAYLGQTAIHLRELFRFAQSSPSVLVFDEVDALGKRRGSPLDVGELDRIVIAFMQELEHSTPAGFVVATSNLPGQLDSALWRRFDYVAEFPRPSKRQLAFQLCQLSKKYSLKPSATLKAAFLKCRSFAEAERLVQADVRRRILARVRP